MPENSHGQSGSGGMSLGILSIRAVAGWLWFLLLVRIYSYGLQRWL